MTHPSVKGWETVSTGENGYGPGNRLSPAETPPETTGDDLPETEAGTVQVRVSERTWGFNSPLAHVGAFTQ